MKSKNGYSLIELIVVMTIIIVITAVGVISFGGINTKSRDNRRLTDLEKIKIALEMVRQVGKTYPDTGSAKTTLENGYLDAWPKDPKGNNYLYESTAGNYGYYLYASLEDVGSTNYDVANGKNCGTVNCNYRTRSP